MFAARSGHADAVVALLSLGAQVNAAESLRGTTALMWAAEHGHAAVLEVLLEHGADIQQQSRVFTPVQAAGLGWARGPGPARQLRADAQPGASPGLYRRGDMTALLYAVREGHTDCVKMLLEAGAKIDGPAVDGSTPLLVAVQNGRYDIANYLLAKGANVNTPNEKGWTPLYLAVKSHDQEITSVPGPHNEGSLEFIVALLDHGADPNVRIKAETEVHQTMNSLWLKEAGATPLLRAALCGDLTVVKMLLAHKADPNIPTFDNTTPLMVAAGVGWSDGMLKEHSPEETLELMKLLVDLGGDVNKANDHGITALHGAGFKGANKVVEYLVSKGANMAALDKGEDYGFGKSSVPMTPLDWATGVPIGMSSAIFHDETVKLIVKLMQERGIPVEFHTYHLAKDESYGGIGQQYPTTQ
jgi:ankyrin repeat protein